MSDADRIPNLLERIELLLETIRGELEIARIDRGEYPNPGVDRRKAMGELSAAQRALDGLRQPDWP